MVVVVGILCRSKRGLLRWWNEDDKHGRRVSNCLVDDEGDGRRRLLVVGLVVRR